MGGGILQLLAGALRTAGRPFRLALERMHRLLAFVRDFIVDFAGDITYTKMVIIGAVATGLALGVGSAVVFIRGDDDESPSASAPVATVAANVTSSATTAASATTPAPTASSSSNIITLRGELDDAVMAASGLTIAEHSIEIVLFTDTGGVTGSMVIAIDAFPIGQILAATFDGADDPEWARFKECTVRLTLDGVVTGTYDRAAGTIAGETRVTPVREDVRKCLDDRPPNVSVDGAIEASTFTWTASFDGRTANGMTQLKPPTAFTATVVE